jgi:DNA-binding MarR family transcriptional regulator
MPSETLEPLLALAAANARAVRALEVSGLSFAELRLLAAIASPGENVIPSSPPGRIEGRRPTDLAQELHLTASGVTRALLPLEKRGIVGRERDPADARASLVRLTPAGRTLLDEALAQAAERATRLLRRLSVGQAKQLARLLDEIGR